MMNCLCKGMEKEKSEDSEIFVGDWTKGVCELLNAVPDIDKGRESDK